MRKGWLLTLLLFANWFLSQNQYNSNVNSNQLNSLVSEYKKLYQLAQEITKLTSKETEFENWNLLWSQNEISKEKIKFKAPKENWFHKLNLTWVSDVAYNFKPGFAENEDLFYQTRISTGLDYPLFGTGSYHSRKRKESLFQYELKKDSIAAIYSNKNLERNERKFIVQKVFDDQKLMILENYQVFLKNLYGLEQQKFRNNLINAAELSRHKKDVEDVSSKIETLKKSIYPENIKIDENIISLPHAKVPDLPKIEELDFNTLLKEEQEILKIQKEIAAQKSNLKNELDLRLKFRYNFYDSGSSLNFGQGRTFATIGATFNLPLSKTKEYTDEYMIQNSEAKLKNNQTLIKNTLYSFYRDYREMQEDVQLLKNKNKYLQELLKLESQAEKLKPESPAQYISYTKELIENHLQILDKKQDLLEKYYEFMLISGFEPGIDHFEQAKEKSAKMENRGKATYLWNSFFLAKNNDYLINLLNLWHIEKVFLSFSKNSDFVKIADFLQLASENQIQVHRLIGENSYAQNDNGFKNLKEVLIQSKELGFEGIHLDIEPHVFDDYKEKIEVYKKREIDLFVNSKKWCEKNKQQLSVSIPMHLPLEVAKVLDQQNIPAYIMAYDVLSLDKKLSKTQELRNVLKGNAIWVFRINDFKNFESLMDAETKVIENKVDKIAYYDLSQMDLFKK